jgi:hypothetical protein
MEENVKLNNFTNKRGAYKVKAENIKKLRIYLEKIKNER